MLRAFASAVISGLDGDHHRRTAWRRRSKEIGMPEAWFKDGLHLELS
jgi:hypothetical protein